MFIHLKITFVNLFSCLVMFFITNSQYRIFIVPRKHYCQKYNILKKVMHIITKKVKKDLLQKNWTCRHKLRQVTCHFIALNLLQNGRSPVTKTCVPATKTA